MALPPQVQAQLDAAEATLNEARSQDQNTTEAAFAAPAPAVEQVQQASPQPQPAPEATPPVQKTDEWETRYKVLQGKYNAEVPDLHRKVHTLEQNLQQTIQKLDEVSQVKTQPEPVKAVDPKDAENFGSDLVEMVHRVASAALANVHSSLDGKLSKLVTEIEALKQQQVSTTQTVALTAEQSFFDKLGKLMPEWEAINADPRFLAWLADVDPVYGLPRQAALRRAQDSLNADHAAAVFKAFKGPEQPKPQAPDPLEQQVSPKSSGAEAPQPVNSQIISAAQITKFYDEVRKGEWRGREQEAQRIEGLINAALAEGRVR
jgi:hypothetical protein